MPLYFAYGSNMHRARIEARVGRLADLGWATLPHYRHAFSKRGEDGTGKGNIAPAPGDLVHGVLYELTAAQLDLLAGFEGGYRRVALRGVVRGGGAPLLTASFRAFRDAHGLRPTAEYLAHYRRGMREHGLPDAYVARVLAAARPPLR